MKVLIATILLMITCSCSTFTVENAEVYPIDHLTPTTIETDHGVVNVMVDALSFQEIYDKFWQDIIIPAHLNWYNSDGQLVLDSVAVDLEIKGSGSAKYELKSLGFTFHEDVNNREVQILTPEKVLDQHSLRMLKSVRVRSSGSDFFGTMFKDLAYTRMAIDANLDLDLMYGEPVHVFVNGDYYGLLNVRNESNEYAISRLRQSETDDITLLDVDSDNDNLEFRAGNELLAQSLIRALKNKETYVLWELIDINNFIDYIIFEDYIGNNDWPGGNSKAYSLNGEPFRFFLFDLDRAADKPRNHMLPELEYRDADVALIYQALIKHPEFCDRLKARQKEIYDKLSTDVFNEIVSAYAARIEDDIDYQIGRYNIPESKLHWRLSIEEIIRDFERQDWHARNKYGL